MAAALAGCGGGDGTPSGDELARLARPPALPAIASERIYFVLTDRYANGDRSNDRGGVTGTREATGFDPTDAGYYHGGDLRGLTAGLQRIKNLGFTAVWLTPVVKQKPVQSGSAAYHGYWGADSRSVCGSSRHFGPRIRRCQVARRSYASPRGRFSPSAASIRRRAASTSSRSTRGRLRGG